MAHTAPTPQQFQARFPAFAHVDSTLIAMVLAEAAGSVDTGWIERDYAPAIMYLTAHKLTMEGHLNKQVIGQTGLITSESLGDASTTYAAPTGTAANSQFSQTEYGRAFVKLQRVNVGGPIVIT